MSVWMRCCIKLRQNLLVVSEQDQIFHMMYVYPNLVLEYHVDYFWLMVLVSYQIQYQSFWQKKKSHSFLNINLLTNPNVLGKSKRRSRKSIPSTITTPTISGLFKTLDFTSSLINVFLGIYSFYHQYDTDLAELVLEDM